MESLPDPFKVLQDSVHNNRPLFLPSEGMSMFPLFLPGDKLEVTGSKLPDLKKGDIVAFRCGEKMIVHRIIGISGEMISCRGDNSNSTEKTNYHKNILGRISRRKRQQYITSTNSFCFNLHKRFILALYPFSFYMVRILFKTYIVFKRRYPVTTAFNS